MVGIMEWKEEKGRRIRVERDWLLGLPCQRATVPVREGMRERARLRRVARGARELVRSGVRRVLTQAGFPCWEALEEAGLRPVETEAFCQMLAPALALAALRCRERRPEQAAVLLSGTGVSPALFRTAEQLCPQVRDFMVDAGEEGEELAAWLRAEFGAAVRPPEGMKADVTLCFGPSPAAGETVFRLYGPTPDLAGFLPAIRGETLPAGLDRLPLLALLWEEGRIGQEQLNVLPPNTKLLT